MLERVNLLHFLIGPGAPQEESDTALFSVIDLEA